MVLDRGSRVNVVTQDTAQTLGLSWEPIALNVRMAGNTTLLPKRDNLEFKTVDRWVGFSVRVVVLTIKSIEGSYQILMGRPWLKEAKAEHDWYGDRISVNMGMKKKYIEF